MTPYVCLQEAGLNRVSQLNVPWDLKFPIGNILSDIP